MVPGNDGAAPTLAGIEAAHTIPLARKLYSTQTATATDYAAAKLAQQFGLCMPTARLVCHLAGIGRAAR